MSRSRSLADRGQAKRLGSFRSGAGTTNPGGTRVVNLATSETLHVPARCAARWNRPSSMVVGVSTKGEVP